MLETVMMPTPLHYLYLARVVMILTVMICRKGIPAVCIVFLFLLGVVGFHSAIGDVQVVFSSILYAASQFMETIAATTLVTVLSERFSDLGNDYPLVAPMAGIMKDPPVTWWILGPIMLLFSLFLWPSPSVVLMSAITSPSAVQAGFRPLAVVMAMNLFGHGVALSYDLAIQGASAISASSAGITTTQVLSEGRPVSLTMVATVVPAVSFLDRKTPADSDFKINAAASQKEEPEIAKAPMVPVVCTPFVSLADIVFIPAFNLRGGDATSTISGAAVFLVYSSTIMGFERQSLEKITDYVTGGFLFATRIFAPVTIIGAFFFLDSSGITGIIGGGYEGGAMNDWAVWPVQHAPLNKYTTAMIQVIAGGLTGLSGSGLSGFPLTGTLARTFGTAVNASIPVLAALGQIAAILMGDGTITPWGIIPVTAICNIGPIELARKNLALVLIRFLCTFLVTCPIL